MWARSPCLHIAEWNTYRAHSLAAGISVSRRAPGTGALDHVAFNAADLAGVKSRLSAHGVDYSINEVPGAGITQLFLKDPQSGAGSQSMSDE